MNLLLKMRSQRVELGAIAEDRGMINGYSEVPLAEVNTEQELMWLMDVGLLRREVDGQGLTDSFRLTPLGRQLLETWQSKGCPDGQANILEYVQNLGSRWLRLPGWLQ